MSSSRQPRRSPRLVQQPDSAAAAARCPFRDVLNANVRQHITSFLKGSQALPVHSPVDFLDPYFDRDQVDLGKECYWPRGIHRLAETARWALKELVEERTEPWPAITFNIQPLPGTKLKLKMETAMRVAALERRNKGLRQLKCYGQQALSLFARSCRPGLYDGVQALHLNPWYGVQDESTRGWLMTAEQRQRQQQREQRLVSSILEGLKTVSQYMLGHHLDNLRTLEISLDPRSPTCINSLLQALASPGVCPLLACLYLRERISSQSTLSLLRDTLKARQDWGAPGLTHLFSSFGRFTGTQEGLAALREIFDIALPTLHELGGDRMGCSHYNLGPWTSAVLLQSSARSAPGPQVVVGPGLETLVALGKNRKQPHCGVNEYYFPVDAAALTRVLAGDLTEDLESTDEEGARPLPAIPTGPIVVAPLLRTLRFHRANLHGSAMEWLARAIGERHAWPNLERLYLDHCGVGGEDMALLSRAMMASSHKFPRLHLLYLSNNKIGVDGARALGEALAAGCCPRLTHVYLDGSELGDEALAAFAGALAAPGVDAAATCAATVEELGLQSNRLGVQGLKALADAVDCGIFPRLAFVHLEFNRALGDEEAAPLLKAMLAGRG